MLDMAQQHRRTTGTVMPTAHALIKLDLTQQRAIQNGAIIEFKG
jgi:hypothetical protein